MNNMQLLTKKTYIYSKDYASNMIDIIQANEKAIMSAIESFSGLPHRLERFAEKNGITFYDDSISTIPEACINAIESVKNSATVIVGGMDRGIDYDVLEDYIRETPEITFILCYATGDRIYRELGFNYEDNSIYPKEFGNVMSTTYIPKPEEFYKNETLTNVMLTTNLDYALELAIKHTPEGRACLLSPAAPSYGYFKEADKLTLKSGMCRNVFLPIHHQSNRI